MPEWFLADDGHSFEYRDGNQVLATLRHDSRAGQFGSYVDGDGRLLSRRFDEAKALIEKSVSGELKGQGRLKL